MRKFDPRDLVAFRSDFDKAVETEIMRSDGHRALYLAIVFLALSLGSVASAALFPNLIAAAFLNRYPVRAIGLSLAAVFLYEFFYSSAIRHFLRIEKKFPIYPRFVNAFIETSIPTVLIYFVARSFGAQTALAVPATLAYFLFIGLSPLRLDYRVSLFAGAAAALQYLAVAHYVSNSPLAAGTASIEYLPQIQGAKALIIFVAGVIAAFVAYQIERRIVTLLKARDEQHRITQVFGQHVSPAVMAALLDQSSGGRSELREVCVMFLDIRDFTSFSQHREPAEVVEHLNRLFAFMVEIVNDNHGFINKFLGDGFMAVFGAPFSSGQDSADAIRSARRIVQRLRAEVASGRITETRIGIGIHSGRAIVGNVGSSLREEYTIIGDAVNLASRIEPLNKTYGSTILVSRETLEACSREGAAVLDESTAARSLGSVRVKGRDEAVEVFCLA